jgi:ABC-type uncharacterized transport system permease subunit
MLQIHIKPILCMLQNLLNPLNPYPNHIGAVIDWTSGNLSLANGADLIIEGTTIYNIYIQYIIIIFYLFLFLFLYTYTDTYTGTLRVNTSNRAPVF